jgi:hypothetical protein
VKIELLYFEGCLHWQLTKEMTEQVLAEKGIDGGIEMVRIESAGEARSLAFMGSPSLRVDGKDVEPGELPMGYNLECRIYWMDGRPEGAPKREWIEAAISAAA